MNKLALAIITGTFFAVGNAYATDPVRNPVDATKAKVRAEKVEERMEDHAKVESKAKHEEAEGKYKAAKERCDELKGADERACKKEAKADYDRTEKDIKATYKTAKRNADAAGEVHTTRR